MKPILCYFLYNYKNNLKYKKLVYCKTYLACINFCPRYLCYAALNNQSQKEVKVIGLIPSMWHSIYIIDASKFLHLISTMDSKI